MFFVSKCVDICLWIYCVWFLLSRLFVLLFVFEVLDGVGDDVCEIYGDDVVMFVMIEDCVIVVIMCVWWLYVFFLLLLVLLNSDVNWFLKIFLVCILFVYFFGVDNECFIMCCCCEDGVFVCDDWY